jgi:hypothetical protein
LDGNESWVSFKKPLTINKKGKTKITGQKSTDAENDESASGHLASTDEANSAGDLPAADVGGKRTTQIMIRNMPNAIMISTR